MKQSLIGISLMAVTAAGSAWGADMSVVPDMAPARIVPRQPFPPLYNWTGFYLGLNGGGAWGESRQTQIFPPNLSTGEFKISGGLVGGTLGFNLQINQVVWGLEGDLDWAGVSGSTGCPTPGFTCSTSSSYLLTGRGRVGFAIEGWLPYVTGGAAIAQVKQSFSPSIGINNGVQTNRVGWTVGAGLEYAIGYTGWTVKAEYLHADFGTYFCNLACAGVANQTIGTQFTEEIFRAGINYRLK